MVHTLNICASICRVAFMALAVAAVILLCSSVAVTIVLWRNFVDLWIVIVALWGSTLIVFVQCTVIILLLV